MKDMTIERAVLTDIDAQMRDMELTYILAFTNAAFKSMAYNERFLASIWASLKKMFIGNPETAIDAKFSKLLNFALEKWENSMKFSNRVEEVVNELDKASHSLS